MKQIRGKCSAQGPADCEHSLKGPHCLSSLTPPCLLLPPPGMLPESLSQPAAHLASTGQTPMAQLGTGVGEKGPRFLCPSEDHGGSHLSSQGGLGPWPRRRQASALSQDRNPVLGVV